jgi:CheY-like chemotaxis protein
MVPAKGINRGRFSVLITDDDPEFRTAVCESITPRGYHAVTASSGTEAIEVVRHEPVHALIMDVNMPDIDGIQAFETIELIVSVHLPCIFMSGHLTEEMRLRAMLARAYTILPKPLNLHLVQILLDQIISKFYGVQW